MTLCRPSRRCCVRLAQSGRWCGGPSADCVRDCTGPESAVVDRHWFVIGPRRLGNHYFSAGTIARLRRVHRYRPGRRSAWQRVQIRPPLLTHSRPTIQLHSRRPARQSRAGHASPSSAAEPPSPEPGHTLQQSGVTALRPPPPMTALLPHLRSRATCEVPGPHSAAAEFPDTEEVTGSIPVTPTHRPLTSPNSWRAFLVGG
jgi:hypothetical protein